MLRHTATTHSSPPPKDGVEVVFLKPAFNFGQVQ